MREFQTLLAMESSKKGHRLREYGHATVVQYDLTSSEEELDDDHSYIYVTFHAKTYTNAFQLNSPDR